MLGEIESKDNSSDDQDSQESESEGEDEAGEAKSSMKTAYGSVGSSSDEDFSYEESSEEEDSSKEEEEEEVKPPNRDEYLSGDSSDEEQVRNTIGNVPMIWYDGYDHIGYDLDGKKIMKPNKGTEIDNFLKRMEDPDFWRTVKDPQTGQDVVLSEADIDLITRIQKQQIPDSQFDEYAVSFRHIQT